MSSFKSCNGIKTTDKLIHKSTSIKCPFAPSYLFNIAKKNKTKDTIIIIASQSVHVESAQINIHLFVSLIAY